MIIPVGADGGAQEYLQIDRGHDGELTQKTLFGVRYVPLVEGKLPEKVTSTSSLSNSDEQREHNQLDDGDNAEQSSSERENRDSSSCHANR